MDGYYVPHKRVLLKSHAGFTEKWLQERIAEDTAPVREVEPTASLKYNKNYIGIARDGVVSNFVAFRPRKHHVIGEFKIPSLDALQARVEDAGIEVMAYHVRWGNFRLQLTEEDLEEHDDLLRELIRLAHTNYGL